MYAVGRNNQRTFNNHSNNYLGGDDMNPKIIQFPHDATDCIVRMNVLADILMIMPPEQIVKEGVETFLAIAEIARKLATVAQAMLEEGRKC